MEKLEVVDLLVGGIPVAVFVIVVVQALKWSNLLRTENETRIAVVIASVIGAGVWAAMTLFPEIGPVVQVLFTAIVGAGFATLGYQGYRKLRNGNGNGS